MFSYNGGNRPQPKGNAYVYSNSPDGGTSRTSTLLAASGRSLLFATASCCKSIALSALRPVRTGLNAALALASRQKDAASLPLQRATSL